MILAILIGLAIGCLIGIFAIPFNIPYDYSPYVAVAIFACIDTVVGGTTANLRNNFKLSIFVSGFFVNAIVASLLALLGNKLGIDVYLAIIIVFVHRIFKNFTSMRRTILEKDVDENKNTYIPERNDIEKEKTNYEKPVTIKKKNRKNRKK